MDPFVLDESTVPTVSKNISDLLLNHLHCPAVQTVVFSYGFHGRRKEVFDAVMTALAAYPHRFIPFLLCCSEEENLRRMCTDGRDAGRVERALTQSRAAFADVPYPQIDITELSAAQAAESVLHKAGLA